MNRIKSYKNGKTISKISYAGSMMTQIALACDEVQAYDNAIFFVHNAQGIAIGDNREMLDRAKHLENMNIMLSQVYVNKTGKTSDEIREIMDADTYMFGEAIKENGFADLIIDTNQEQNKELAMASAKNLFNKSKKALKEEGLTALDLEEQVQLCERGCSLASMPSLEEKIANSNKGHTVTKEELQTELDTANSTIEANKVEMSGMDEKVVALEKELSTAQADLATASEAKDTMKSDFEAKSEVMATAVSKGLEMGASKEAIQEAMKSEGNVQAENIILKSVISDGATIIGEPEKPAAKADAWENIVKKGK